MSDQWRYRCPHGDTSWSPYGDGYYCHTCKTYGRDPRFDRLRDVKHDTVKA